VDESERAFVTPTVPVYPCGPAEKRKGEPTTPCKHLCSLQEERFAKSAPRVADLERRIFQAAAHSFAARRAGGSDWGPIPWLHAMGADSGGEVGGRESTRGSTLQKVSSGPLPWMVTRGHAMWRDLSWREASGSLGDLGTFLPLLVGLTVESGLDVGTTLITTGVYNLITGMVFDVPMPVQPMKTIAAVALSDASLTMPQIISAGVFVSAVVFFLGATGLIDRFNDFTPKAVVHGMQIGLGVLLCVKAFTMSLFVDGDGGDGDYVIRTFLGADGLLLCACSLVLATVPLVWKIGKQARCDDETDEENADGRELVGDGTGNRGSAAVTGNTEPAGENTETETSASEVTVEEGIDIDATVGEKKDEGVDSSTVRSTREKKTKTVTPPPTALLLVLIGLGVSMTQSGSLTSLKIGPSTPGLIKITPADFVSGIVKAGLPQLPLTTLNSVVAVCALSKDLFPDRPATPKLVATSVGAMNLIGAAIGVMPVCHGAGGLAAHYHFGARRGAATAFLGACKLFFGVLFGGSMLSLLREFPKTVLGVMLGAASVELVKAAVSAFLSGRGKAASRCGNRAGTGDETNGGLNGDDDDVIPSYQQVSLPPLWREPDSYALLATAVATAASGNTGIGVGIGLLTAAATRFLGSDRVARCGGWRNKNAQAETGAV
jgi:predicted benzoate:H+ symporter BenE